MAGFFGLFNYSKAGKGLSKEDVNKSGVELYFDIIGRRIWKLVTLNLIFLVVSIPAIAIGIFLSVRMVTALAILANVELSMDFAKGLSMLGVFASFILLHLIGSGPASAGFAYVLRRYVNDTHSWVFSDFVDNIKSNFWQSMLLYVINVVVCALLLAGAVYYLFILKGLLGMMLFWVVVFVAAIFFMMQMYTYQLMVSFKLKLKDIYKNSLLLVLVKLPWNIFAFALSMVLVYAVYSTMSSVPLAGVMIIAVILYSLVTFTQIFMTNNVVKKYLLNEAEKVSQNDAQTNADEI